MAGRLSQLLLNLIASAIVGLAQSRIGQFNRSADCSRTPDLIRDAAKDARVAIRTICYVTDRARFALKAGEAFARELDRTGDMVRVVVPFGHLLVVNGTEPAVQMAVRRYEAESLLRLKAARFAGQPYFREFAEVADRAAMAIRTLRRAYAGELELYKRLMPTP